MAWNPITLAPGLNIELTPTDLRGGYSSTDLGRFKAGRFQKLGGWTKYYQNRVAGAPRSKHAWQALDASNRLAIGTTSNLYDLTSGNIKDITPQTITTTPSPSFSTIAGSPLITITDAGINGITTYDAVYFDVPISVDGLVLHGMYQITAYVSAHAYKITATGNALTGVTAQGTVPTFTVTAGNDNVSVTIVKHNLLAGDDVVFKLATTVGGIVIQGRYVVQSITSADVFVITAAVAAASTPGVPVSMNSGNAGFTYFIALGPVAAGGDYGTGNYGDGAYGVGGTITAQVGTPITSTDWSLGNWGELLISSPEGGGIYYWGPSSGFSNTSIITTAPVYNEGAFLSNAQQMIITYGSTVKAAIGEYQDPLMIKWCDSEDLTMWTAASTNEAGSWRLATGSRCVGGASMPNRNVVWTDQAVWALDYIGASLVFGVTEKASGCGLIAKHAHCKLGEILLWMSTNGIWSMSGESVTQLNCPVFDAIFQDLDLTNAARCHAGANSDYTEAWFFWPSKSGGLGYCDKYAKFNIIEGTWDIGAMQRNTWLDRSVVGNPVATTNGGAIYAHESGYDADTSPLMASFTTSWIYAGEGQDCVFVDRIYPDMKWGEYAGSDDAAIELTVYAVQYAGGPVKTYGPFTVNKAKNFISKRFRARQISLKVSSSGMGSFWRLGHFRIRWAFDGRGR
jgi:hypothetical protein